MQIRARQKDRTETNPALSSRRLKLGTFQTNLDSGCVMSDLDRFKSVNDSHGHAIGDKVLKQVSARLWGATRETDMLARLGADEFALLLRPIERPADAASIAERIVRAMTAPFTVDNCRVVIGASVGIALSPADGDNADTLLQCADMAMRRAKDEATRGRSIMIMPEGTRLPPGRAGRYHPGVAALYTHLGLTVVPVALNSGLYWGRRSLLLRPGTVTMEFLPPIPPGLERKAFMSLLQERIETASERLRLDAPNDEKAAQNAA